MATTDTPNKTAPKAANAKPQASGSAPPKPAPKPLPKAVAPGDAAQQTTLGQRLMGMLRGSRVTTTPSGTGGAKAAANATEPKTGMLGTPPGYWRKFLQGSLIFVGGSYIIIIALTYIAAHYPALGLGGYIQPPKANVFVLSGLTWENLIFFVVIIGLWLLVQRLGLMPKPQPYTPNPARGSTGTTGSSAAKGGKKSGDELPGIGERRTRAERRYAAAVAADQEAQKAATRAKAKGGAKAAPVAAAPAKNGKAAGVSSKAAATVASPKEIAGEHDEMYERVKADQRLRRRREAKR